VNDISPTDDAGISDCQNSEFLAYWAESDLLS